MVDEHGRFAGAVNLHDVHEALRVAADPGATVARDLVRPRFEATTPGEPLARVLERFAAQESERLPVLAEDGSGRLLGTISKRDILAAYARDLLERRAGGERSPVAGPPPPQATVASSYRYSTNDSTAPSKPATFGFVDSIT